MTLFNIGLIVVGIILVIWGADRMTDGASKLARDMRVPEIVIGLTIVAAGTSAPELFVSLMSALKGTPDLAVGNVIGSNIFNTLLIVGCSAAVAPIAVAPNTVKKDIPFAIGASLLLFMLCADDMGSVHLWGNEISRSDGIILLIGFVAFMVYTFQMAAKDGQLDFLDEELLAVRRYPSWLPAWWLLTRVVRPWLSEMSSARMCLIFCLFSASLRWFTPCALWVSPSST